MSDTSSMVSDCELWQGHVTHGYPSQGKLQARRIVWEAAYGSSPEGAIISVACGNRLCVNADHLFARQKKSTSDDWQDHAIPEPNSGCWLWEGSVDGRGYGKFIKKGKHRQAHKVAWETMHGPVPRGLYICHRCDNKLCVNPAHLFAGTPSDNMQDHVRKGRHFRFGQTHCKRGHPLVEGNLYYQQNRNSVSRICKQCVLDGNRRRRLECR